MRLRTDLAREAYGLNRGVEGVTERTETVGAVTLSTIDIKTRRAAELLDKRVGRYVTVEIPNDARDDTEAAVDCIARALLRMLPDKYRRVLVIGLGNRLITPDSLGPRTVERVFVTRHIEVGAPELALDNMRSVSAFAPSVLGVTGIETVEAVRALTSAVRPDVLLCIDALAASEANRIGSTVQINDSGLLPGGGVGNRQQGLNRESLGVPVLAIGVPTVVYAATIACEAVRMIAEQAGLADQSESLEALARKLADERMGEMVVTPKDVDALVDDAARRISHGINRALHGDQYTELAALLTH